MSEHELLDCQKQREISCEHAECWRSERLVVTAVVDRGQNKVAETERSKNMPGDVRITYQRDAFA